MDTNELIKALAADARRPRASLLSAWWWATGLASALAALVFAATVDMRPDIVEAAGTLRFLIKFVVTLTLASGAFYALRALSRPEGNRHRLPQLIVAPALLVAAVVVELIVVPPEAWPERMIGASNIYCLLLIMLIGVGPLSVLLLALHHGAPANPGVAGAVAGLLAGGIAAAVYAAHCTDDSPLFVATWYTMAIAGLAGLGAVVARRSARW
jgi:hypothetical protein